jgi:hypothetical protein
MVYPRKDFTDMRCVVCSVPLCSLHEWRQGVRPEGRKPHSNHGMCDACRRRAKYVRVARRPSKPTGPQALTEQMLDEYALIRDDVMNIRQAAKRLGVTFTALDRALYRARKRGDTRGNAPLAQIDIAHRRGGRLPIVHQEGT